VVGGGGGGVLLFVCLVCVGVGGAHDGVHGKISVEEPETEGGREGGRMGDDESKSMLQKTRFKEGKGDCLHRK